MIDFLKRNKTAIGGVLALVLAGYIYFTYFSGSGAPALSSTSETSPVTTDLLMTLQSIHTIKLDNAIFSNPAFISLSDFGVTIPPEAVGRRNPFAPLQGVSSGNKSNIPLAPGVH